MANDKVTLDLKPMPDGYGFIYGEAYRGDDHHTINVLPPERYWQGQFRLEGHEPHETDWVLYIDGEEVARVTENAGIEGEFTRLLLEG